MIRVLSTAATIAFDVKAAKVYAALRSERSLKAPDAIQLACVASAKVDLFITNDDLVLRHASWARSRRRRP